MKNISLALRNLTRQKKRSFLLGGAIAFGFFVVMLIDALAAGAVVSLTNQFAQLFAGHILIEGFEKTDNDKLTGVMRNDAVVLNAIESAQIPTVYVSKRSALYGTLIFEGQKAGMNIFGCDLDQELFLRDSLTLVDGSWENMKEKNALIIGDTTADDMKLQVGDAVLFEMTTVSGQKNIGEFIIAIISKDSGLLGSISTYANRSYVNELLEIKPDESSLISIMIPDQAMQNVYAARIEAELGKTQPVVSRTEALTTNPTQILQGINRQLKKTEWTGTKFAVSTLNDQLGQLNQIVSALQYASLGILAVLFLVVMIGIANTFKMIVFERIREIGTMRAVGVKRNAVRSIFIWEAVLLAICGAFAGFILSVIAMSVLSLFTFNSPELSIILQNGHFEYVLSAQSIILKFVLIIILTVIAVQSSASQAAKMNPAEALRTTK